MEGVFIATLVIGLFIFGLICLYLWEKLESPAFFGEVLFPAAVVSGFLTLLVFLFLTFVVHPIDIKNEENRLNKKTEEVKTVIVNSIHSILESQDKWEAQKFSSINVVNSYFVDKEFEQIYISSVDTSAIELDSKDAKNTQGEVIVTGNEEDEAGALTEIEFSLYVEVEKSDGKWTVTQLEEKSND